MTSTALKQRLGDRASADIFRKHHDLIRETLRIFSGGEEIETAGDSFLLAFSKPSEAVQFALMLQARLRKLSKLHDATLCDRVGVHLGEVVIGNEDAAGGAKNLFGIQIDTCARVMSLAGPGQILLTRAVFDNARQCLKGEDNAELGPLEWLNHGSYLLKGVEQAAEICEVREAGQVTSGSPAGSEKAQRQVRAEEEPVLGWRPAVGQFVPNTRWGLQRKLGEGGFGEVWLGQHQELKEKRVFKFCFRADRVRSLKREMTLFRLIKERIGDHPNIVALRNVYFEAAPFYIEEDYVDGPDLRSWCDVQGGAGKVSLKLKLELMAQAADGLQAAHDSGVIHRDVKPGNILVAQAKGGATSTALEVKLTDFGIGQVVSEASLAGMTRAGFTKTLLGSETSSQTGTQLYMAPELLAGKPASTRSDIYSLGIVLYQLLVGDLSRPLTTDWDVNIRDLLLRDDLRHCFAGNPQDRFAGAGQLAERLRTYEQRQAARLEAERAERTSRRRRRAVVFGFGFALLMLLLSGTLGYGLRRASLSEQRLRREQYVADMEVADLALKEGNRGFAQRLVTKYSRDSALAGLRGFEWRHLWKRCQGQELFTIQAHSNRVTALAFAGESTLWSGGSDGVLKRWNLASQEELPGLAIGDGWIEDLAVTPSGAAVFVGWSTGVAMLEGPSFKTPRHLNGATLPLEMSPDGQTLLTGSTNGAIIWNAVTGERVQTLRQVASGPFAFSSDAVKVAMPLRIDNSLKIGIWKTASLRARGERDEPVSVLLHTNGFVSRPNALAFSPDGQMLAGEHPEGVQLWNSGGGSPVGWALNSLTAQRHGIAFLPHGKTLLTWTGLQDFRTWDISVRTNVVPLDLIPGHLHEIETVARTPSGHTFASGGKDGTIKLWNAPVFEERLESKDQISAEGFLTAFFSHDGRRLFTAFGNGSLTSWDTATLQPLASYRLPSSLRVAVASPKGNHLAVGLTNGEVQLWNVPDREQAPQLQYELHSGHTNGTPEFFAGRQDLSWTFPLVAWSGDEQRLAAVLGDIYVWDASAGQTVRKIPAAAKVWSIALSDDGSILAAGVDESSRLANDHIAAGSPQNVELWEVPTGRKLACVGHKDITIKLAFSPDGKTLASASLDNTIGLWRVPSGSLRASLTSYALAVFHVAFSPDGRTLATRGADDSLKLWNVETARELMTLTLAEDLYFGDVRFSPDGTILGVGVASSPRQIRLIRAPSFQEIDGAASTPRQTPLSSGATDLRTY